MGEKPTEVHWNESYYFNYGIMQMPEHHRLNLTKNTTSYFSESPPVTVYQEAKLLGSPHIF